MSPSQVRANVGRVRERIVRAAARAGRDPGGVRIVAVAKRQPAPLVEAAIAAGLGDIGENYVQEAAEKRAQVRCAARWHMIGHLQRNKVARALQVFDVIQTLDRAPLARALASRVPPGAPALPVLIQVNVAGDPSKAGVNPEQAAELAAEVRALEGLRLLGLMTIPPPGPAESARPHFSALRRLARELGVAELSMGMSDDLEVAVEEGATIVRVGRAIFGERG